MHGIPWVGLCQNFEVWSRRQLMPVILFITLNVSSECIIGRRKLAVSSWLLIYFFLFIQCVVFTRADKPVHVQNGANTRINPIGANKNLFTSQETCRDKLSQRGVCHTNTQTTSTNDKEKEREKKRWEPRPPCSTERSSCRKLLNNMMVRQGARA